MDDRAIRDSALSVLKDRSVLIDSKELGGVFFRLG